jgi:hypothetical protein
MKYIKKLNEGYGDPNDLKNSDTIQDLNDMSLELKDDGFDFKIREFYYQPKDQTFIICNILSTKFVTKVNSNIIDIVLRMVDYMYHNSFDLGTNNWSTNCEGKLRVFINGWATPYTISKEELSEFINVDFKRIELVFAPII